MPLFSHLQLHGHQPSKIAKSPGLIGLDFRDLQKIIHTSHILRQLIWILQLWFEIAQSVSFIKRQEQSHSKSRGNLLIFIFGRFICLIPQSKNAPNSHKSRNIVELHGSVLSMQISQPTLMSAWKIMSCRKLKPSDEIVLWNVAWESSFLCVIIWCIFAPKLKWTGKEPQLMKKLKISDKFTRCLLRRKGRGTS